MYLDSRTEVNLSKEYLRFSFVTTNIQHLIEKICIRKQIAIVVWSKRFKSLGSEIEVKFPLCLVLEVLLYDNVTFNRYERGS